MYGPLMITEPITDSPQRQGGFILKPAAEIFPGSLVCALPEAPHIVQNYLDANPGIHQDKDSSDESSPEACELAAGGKTVRRRARKPFRPTVSTW